MSGIGLVEVLVALMIFSIIAIGMGYSMLSISRLTGDSTARETATNLAAAEIDRIARPVRRLQRRCRRVHAP